MKSDRFGKIEVIICRQKIRDVIPGCRVSIGPEKLACRTIHVFNNEIFVNDYGGIRKTVCQAVQK